MKLFKSIFILIFYFIFSLSLFAEIKFLNDFNLNIKKKFSDSDIKLMYTELCLNDKVSFSCFNNAMHGLEKIEDLEFFNNSNDGFGAGHNVVIKKLILGEVKSEFHLMVNADVFFTEKACRQHIEENKHHYRNPMDYLNFAFRNPEIETLLGILSKIEIKEES